MRRIWLAALAGCVQETQIDEIAPSFVVAPDLSDLGVAPVGVETPFSVSLVHTGGGTLHLGAVVVEVVDGDGFAFVGDAPAVVEPAGALELPFVFAPTAPAWAFATVTLLSDAAEPEVTLQVRARAVEGWVTARPGRVDFGDVPVGQVREADVVITNAGSSPVRLLGADAAAPFAAEVAPTDLAAGATVAVTVTFAPADSSGANGALGLRFEGAVAAGPITLAGNDCAKGAPDRYDLDGDGVTSCGGDCDDRDPDRRPGAAERADGADDDCDGLVDEGTDAYDDDGDGFSELGGDCVDGDAAISPSAAESPDNGVDDDCDGVVDAGTEDRDRDGFSAGGGDCDDTDGDAHPGATEIANAVDDDCDGVTDEGTRRYDDDGDGYTENAGDCDDTDAKTSPKGTETADGEDDDCDGKVDEGTTAADDDGDGFTEDGGDCDDTDAAVSPAAVERVGDGVDDDCDGVG